MATIMERATATLEALIKEIKNKASPDEQRKRAARAIRDLVVGAKQDMTEDQFKPFFDIINQRCASLVQGSETHEHLGGLYILEGLVEFEGVDAPVKISKFPHHISRVLTSKDTASMALAAAILGRLCRPGGSLISDLIDSEVHHSLEFLQGDRVEEKRYGAVLGLRELAKNAPTLVYPYVGYILEHIWSGLRDPRGVIRQVSAETVGACLKIIKDRDQKLRLEWMNKLYNEAMSGFKTQTPESCHGSLLAFKEMFELGGMFIKPHYDDACAVILKFRETKDPGIRRTVISLMPELASYAPERFKEQYLHHAMVWLMGMLKRDKERNDAFIAIGNIANAVKAGIIAYLDGLLQLISEGLSVQSRRRQPADAVFECISRLAVAIGGTLAKYMDALLEPIFSCELTPALTQALVDIAFYIPPVKAQIQERLLDMLSRVLCGEPFRPLGAPQPNSLPSLPVMAKDPKDPTAHEKSRAEVKLALRTLGSFDFSGNWLSEPFRTWPASRAWLDEINKMGLVNHVGSHEETLRMARDRVLTDFGGHVLNEFVRDVAIKYVEDDDPEIREAAALTCCQLFIGDPIVNQTSRHSLQVVAEVVDKLLTVGVGDAETRIRQTVLTALDPRFDPHLGKAENIRTLFFALHDEVFATREIAVRIIGRLAQTNPAYVVPQLRKTIIQLLTELEYTDVPKSREESARLIGLLVSASQDVIKPYVDSIADVLIPKATDPSPIVTATVLSALGDLCLVGREKMLPYKDHLMPLIIGALRDQSSPIKKEAALRTLSALASNAGYVIAPYYDYAHLMDILIDIIIAEPQNSQLRQLTIKLIGVLGALDPNKHQNKGPKSEDSDHVTDVSLMMNGLTPSQEEYYPTVVINALLNIVRDQSLVQWHTHVVDSIMQIFVALGLKCVAFLDRVIPAFVSVIRASPTGKLDYYFNQLAKLISIVRQHIRVHLPSIVSLVQDFWHTPQLQATLMTLVEAISRSLEGEFKIYLAGLLPLMLSVLENDVSSQRRPSDRILHSFLVFGSSAEEYMHLIIPVVVRMFDKPGQPLLIRKQSIVTIGTLSSMVNLNDFAARIIHPLTRAVASGEPSLRVAALDTLCALMGQLGRDYMHFEHTVDKVLSLHGVQHSKYEGAVGKLQRGEALPQDLAPRFVDAEPEYTPEANPQKKLDVNPVHLKQAWDTKGKSTKEDWHEWFRKFSTTLLAESPNHSLRACASLAANYPPLARELFNSAFVSCWSELYDSFQEELISNIESTIKSDNVPPDLLTQLLNLAEFMEHDDRALPIDIRTLGSQAAKCHAFAKALHYKELEFLQDQSGQAVEALISINNQLQQSDAAIGILRKAQAYKDGIQLREGWFEKLERWDEALQHYQEREAQLGVGEHPTFEIVMGKMRCYHALGEWDALYKIAERSWQTWENQPEYQRRIAPLATTAAWGLGRWESMDMYLRVIKRAAPDRAFFGAILALHRNQYGEAVSFIEQAREGLDTELSALISESYSRAYQVIVRVEMLAELEEIIQYKQMGSDKRELMRKTWETRLLGCQRNVDLWQKMLRLRSLVLAPMENMRMWTKFANLCRKSGRLGLAEKSLKQLIGLDLTDHVPAGQAFAAVIPYWTDEAQLAPDPNMDSMAPPVLYALLKFMYEAGQQQGVKSVQAMHLAANTSEKALYCLRRFTGEIAHKLEASAAQYVASQANGVPEHPAGCGFGNYQKCEQQPLQVETVFSEQRTLLAKCYLRQGEWMVALHRDEWQTLHRQEILSSYYRATQFNSKWYKAWHAWALANFDVVQTITGRASGGTNATGSMGSSRAEQATVVQHVVSAIRGFFKSIALSSGSSLQDTLRLLTLWLTHGGSVEVNAVVTEGFGQISIDTWLEVIPQLIARINQPHLRVQQSVQNLLADVGRAHPQALVYPLTVAMKSAHNERRARTAAQIIDSMRQHSSRLVEQADIVSHELIRVAVLWHEQWHDALEEASRLYFGDHNIQGMFATLAPLHDLLDRGPETLRETSFQQTFSRDLRDAHDWCRQYEQSQDVGDLNQAWDLYYQVFKRISRQLPQMTSLDLTYCSPRLLAAKDLELAVPGTYRSGQPIVRIMSFDSTFSVIASKQRPRKLVITGSDGGEHTFLLKGHEDIRQDERVMQLFGLCNTLLMHDAESFKRHLRIQQYPAIPLSQNSGLLGWVPNSDTVHALIRDYRESRKILLNIEHRIMLQMAPDYDNLTLMQKVEVFGYALDNTTGQDLYRVLWLKSRSSEEWLKRRTNYTRSLGVMSMVGYILGLGDRHPSNLMLDRVTGMIVHIDFGDCFEVAMKREKYPERVPFRLTRMLTYAMEVSNIEGSFRITCEIVMRVLRENKESVMAVLEAFIHDPLLTWRLTSAPAGPNMNSERETELVGPHGVRNRRASILDGPPSEILAAQVDGAAMTAGGPPGAARSRARTNSSATANGHPTVSLVNEHVNQVEMQNARAVEVLERVQQKLTGRDFKPDRKLGIVPQVDKLIQEAIKLENLCQHYIGWCSFW